MDLEASHDPQGMNRATRRQILVDMGIASWCLRAVPAAQPRADAAARPPPASAPPSSRPAVSEPAAARPGTVAPARTASAAPQVESWTAVSLALPGVVLLVDGAGSRRDLRLALDVLCAVSGDWGSRPVRRRFDWPPRGAGAELGGDAGDRAFAAFVDKDVADHQARLLICSAGAAQRLPALDGCRRVIIPPLETLGRDADAKRSVWQELRGLPG